MSNIIKDDDTLCMLNDFVTFVSNRGISSDYLEEILNIIIPKKENVLLINYNICFKGCICFNPITKTTVYPLEHLHEYAYRNEKKLKDGYNIKDENVLRAYLYLFCIVHEVEHSYQWLMSKGIIESPNDIIRYGYRGIFELIENEENKEFNRNIRNRLAISLYRTSEVFYVPVLERNANVESFDLLAKCASSRGDWDIYLAFNNVKNVYTTFGYRNTCMGSFEETYRKILLYSKYKKFYEEITMSEEDRVRYGLNVSKKTRKRVLNNLVEGI